MELATNLDQEDDVSTLERAIEIAVDAHKGQADKAGSPYILHPLRVMLSLDASAPHDRIVGVLHDVPEDGFARGWTLERIKAEGFAPEVIEALKAVSKTDDDEGTEDEAGEAKTARYLRFVARAGAHPVGRRVKIADLKDNMDLSRIPSPTEKDYRRLAKYRRAVELLESLPAAGA